MPQNQHPNKNPRSGKELADHFKDHTPCHVLRGKLITLHVTPSIHTIKFTPYFKKVPKVYQHSFFLLNNIKDTMVVIWYDKRFSCI